ncbi:carboxymuconolactone decarboxylase family protein [Mesorhizobium sp. B2-5-4]|uniref:carboxymuconolactone decarboxylase family protein n=1 Tax=Mesorhizobium sp. B2-5-4 TaxID=2589926 RepID=UPI0011270E3F|nr:carboxymuconolactone decarboxylase family protein [Mesorhizobium sp. B2-5-4]TPK45359.1 carboxymuconolactone decarboxylase family protein [Mesorhizobium sp. B2-5-4]
MPRIAKPSSIANAPAAALPMLQAVEKQLGVVRNLFRMVANRPAALEGYLGKTLARLDAAEMIANRHGCSTDPKAAAAVRFAARVAQSRGDVGQEDLAAVRLAGYENGEIIESVQHVALNVWTNYINEVAQTEIDFPVVSARDAA